MLDGRKEHVLVKDMCPPVESLMLEVRRFKLPVISSRPVLDRNDELPTIW